MAPPEWLPPLNSHNNFAINLVASQLDSPMNDLSLREREFRIQISVSVTFCSDKIFDQRIIEGLSMHEVYRLPCFLVRSQALPGESCEEFIANMLDDMRIPFELNEVTWGEKHLRGQFTQESSQLNAISILPRIHCFLNCMSNKYYNLMHNILPVDLEITKKIVLPDSEFKAWCSWFDEKSRVDPDFDIDYLEAISRPRTEIELYEASLEFVAATTRTSTEVLHGLRISADHQKASTICSICLEEMQIGSVAMQLPCSHVFHGECIGKWIKESQRCPLCRSMLISGEFDEYDLELEVNV